MSGVVEAWERYRLTRPGAPHGWNPPHIFAAGFEAGVQSTKPKAEVPDVAPERMFTANDHVRSSGWYGGKE